MIAALFVKRGGPYYGIPDVDPWDEERDARLYHGPWPVVAHPPCSRWCRLAGLVEARWGHKKGEDDGAFESALESVRRWGGVLEHPAYSDAWATYSLPRPARGGWQRGICGGWSCEVDQFHYGHEARKATWLYAFNVSMLPTLNWTRARGNVLVSACANRTRADESRPRIMKGEAAKTPLAFRDLLLDMARSVEEAT